MEKIKRILYDSEGDIGINEEEIGGLKKDLLGENES